MISQLCFLSGGGGSIDAEMHNINRDVFLFDTTVDHNNAIRINAVDYVKNVMRIDLKVGFVGDVWANRHCLTVSDCKHIDHVIRSVNNLRIARNSLGLKLSTSLKTAMDETAILSIEVK